MKEFFKQVKSLSKKKYRLIYQSFVVEGEKSVLETLESNLEIKALIATTEFLKNYQKTNGKDVVCDTILSDFRNSFKHDECKIYNVDTKTLTKLSNIKTNNSVIAVVGIPNLETKSIDLQNYKKDLKIDKIEFNDEEDCILKNKNAIYLALDRISDPSNFGAILRVADWFGVDKVLCSKDTVDIYNPKVIQASMGSFTRISVEYLDLQKLLKSTSIPIYGTVLDGQNIHTTKLAKSCIIVFGNESSGINKDLLPYFDKTITIPKYGKAESLNVAAATAIVCSFLKIN